MMKAITYLFATTILCLTANTIGVAAETPEMPSNVFGTPPPKAIKNWTRISVLGIRNHPYLILWLSSEEFRRSHFERLIVLPQRDYDDVVTIAQNYACLRPEVSFPIRTALLVSVYSSEKGERNCRLPSAARCELMSKLSKISSIVALAHNRQQMAAFATNVGCPLDEPH
jgi:hypothetical protein